MPYPDGMTTAALDRHNGREDRKAEARATLLKARAIVNEAFNALNALADVADPTVSDAIANALDHVELADLGLVVEIGT